MSPITSIKGKLHILRTSKKKLAFVTFLAILAASSTCRNAVSDLATGGRIRGGSLPGEPAPLACRYNITESDQYMFGFFFQCYKQPKATLEAIRSIKDTNMPDAPMYLVSADGYNYSALAQHYDNLKYVHSPEKVNLYKGDDFETNIWTYFRNMRWAAEWCNCTYLVIIEDDNEMKRPLTKPPKHDAGGVSSNLWNGGFPKPLLAKYGTNWSYSDWGMCGGAYVRTAAFMDAYDHFLLDRDQIRDMKRFHWAVGMVNDVTLAVMMMDRGYVLWPWEELAQYGRRKHQNWRPSLIHGNKRFYDKKLTAKDKALLGWKGKRMLRQSRNFSVLE